MSRPACTSTCATPVVPALSNDLCSDSLLSGAIEELYFSDVPMTDVTDALEWTASLDQAGGTGKIITFVIEGELPKADVNTIEARHGRTYYGKRKFELNGVTEIVTQENYDAARELQCGTGLYLIAFRTEDKTKMFTYAEQDIQPSVDANMVWGGKDSLLNIEFDVSWEDTHAPEMITSPIA